MKEVDISGRVFGKVLAINRVDDYIKPSGDHVIRYLCFCECGKIFVAVKHSLTGGRTTTCGCGRGKHPGNRMTHCFFLPVGVDCTELECDNCGWNPYNTELRNRRIANIKRKDGTDE